MDPRYNYIILGSDWDLYCQSYSDLSTVSNAKYIPGRLACMKLWQYPYKTHIKLEKIFKIGGLDIWNRFYTNLDDFEQKRQLCFIYFWGWIHDNLKTGFIDYMKNSYPNSKHILFLQDIVARRNLEYTIKDAQRDFDLIISFDPGDCRKYGFVYHPLVFSHYEAHHLPIKYDVYMLANAKNRLSQINEMYDYLVSKGLIVRFFLAGVPKSQQRQDETITYVNSMSYKKNLLYIEQSKCILEIMQKDGVGHTQRGCEVVGLNKKLLTNNTNIKNEPFYDKRYISVFSDVNDVNSEFLLNLKTDEFVDFGDENRGRLSPIQLLEFIDNII